MLGDASLAAPTASDRVGNGVMLEKSNQQPDTKHPLGSCVNTTSAAHACTSMAYADQHARW